MSLSMEMCCRVWSQSHEQVFLEEEQEKELETVFEKSLAVENESRPTEKTGKPGESRILVLGAVIFVFKLVLHYPPCHIRQVILFTAVEGSGLLGPAESQKATRANLDTIKNGEQLINP